MQHSASNWAVVDDEDLLPPGTQPSLMHQVLLARTVRTDGVIGLQEADADRLIAILNEDEGD